MAKRQKTWDEDRKREHRESVRALIDEMPQADPSTRLSAFVGVAIEASDLEWRDGVVSLVRYVRTMMQAPEARIMLRDEDADGSWWNAEDGRRRDD